MGASTEPEPARDRSGRAGPGRTGAAGMPRWVIVSLIVAAVVVVMVVVGLLTGGHGPGRHAAPGAHAVGVAVGGPWR